MPQSLCPVARYGDRPKPGTISFHLYHNRPIYETAKIRKGTRCEDEKKYCAGHLRLRFEESATPPGAEVRSQPLWGTLTPLMKTVHKGCEDVLHIRSRKDATLKLTPGILESMQELLA
jgi:hypothetical protein